MGINPQADALEQEWTGGALPVLGCGGSDPSGSPGHRRAACGLRLDPLLLPTAEGQPAARHHDERRADRQGDDTSCGRAHPAATGRRKSSGRWEVKTAVMSIWPPQLSAVSDRVAGPVEPTGITPDACAADGPELIPSCQRTRIDHNVFRTLGDCRANA